MSPFNVIDFFTAADRALRFDHVSNVTKKRAHLNAAIANRNKLLTQKRKKQTQTKKVVSNGTN